MRPDFPVFFVARQGKTSCFTPFLDITTSVITRAHPTFDESHQRLRLVSGIVFGHCPSLLSEIDAVWKNGNRFAPTPHATADAFHQMPWTTSFEITAPSALLPYFCTNRRHFNFFIQTEPVLTHKNRSKPVI